MRAGALPLGIVVALGVALGCDRRDRAPASTDAGLPAPSAQPVPSLGTATAPLVPETAPGDARPQQPNAEGAAHTDASAPPPVLPPARTDGCPTGMVRVEGDYCPAVVQECLEHHREFQSAAGNKNVSERCLRYREPSRCVVKQREHLSFCMDRFEYPNRIGEQPRVLTSWLQAKALCEREGKRLCSEDEFNFACEGPELRPYVYGFVRDAERCNIDREYVFPDHSRQLLTYDDCLKDERCAAELRRLDQRHAIGARLTCVAWSGAVDLNGNVNEWVVRRGDKPPPHRSGLKGGWWGPVRNRCRPTVEFHKEYDYGYEAGFRCCKDPTP